MTCGGREFRRNDADLDSSSEVPRRQGLGGPVARRPAYTPSSARALSLHPKPMAAIDSYLAAIYTEACRRGYAFDGAKIGRRRIAQRIPETTGQLVYEW